MIFSRIIADVAYNIIILVDLIVIVCVYNVLIFCGIVVSVIYVIV